MSLHEQGPEVKQQAADGVRDGAVDATSPAAPLEDAELQERYRQEYLLQLRRRACPGCGEAPFEG